MHISKAKAIMEEYLGCLVSEIKVHQDPKVSGTYAFKLLDAEFLLVGYRSGTSAKDAAELIEEVEFTTWPPTSGENRFL